jgi:hypothetical protein
MLAVGIDAAQRLGHVAGEAGQHVDHAELGLALGDLHAERRLLLDPVRGERAGPAADVAHALPGEERRTGEPALNLGVGEADLEPELLPDNLLAGEGERQIDAVQRHPVDLALPARPVPPGAGIRDGAHVHVVAKQIRRAHATAADIDRRERRRQLELVAGAVDAPRHLRAAKRFQVLVQTRRHRHARGAVDPDLPGAQIAHNGELVLPRHALLAGHAQRKFAGTRTEHASRQRLHGTRLHARVARRHRRRQQLRRRLKQRIGAASNQ